MKDSNYTLRFNRTSRDAYGYDLRPEDFDRHTSADVWVFAIMMFAIGFLVGSLV